MLEALLLTIQHTIYVLVFIAVIALLASSIRASLRQFGWDLVVTIRPATNPPVDWDRVRQVVLRRDGYARRNCGGNGPLHVHHIVPLSMGGTNRWSNLITLCRRCHRRLHPDMKDSL